MSQNDYQLDYKLMTKDKIQEAMMIQAETMKQECLAIGMGMFEDPGAPEEIQLLFREILKDGSTIVAVDKKTGELAAVAFTKIHARPREGVKDPLDDFIEENLKRKSCQELVKFLGDLEGSVDIFEKYHVEGAIELFYLGTNPRYQGRGIGSEIVKKCIEFARGLKNGTTKRSPIENEIVNEKVIPELIFGVFLSNYSQRIADKLNFETIREVKYEDFVIGGRKLSERIGDVHKTARLQVLKL